MIKFQTNSSIQTQKIAGLLAKVLRQAQSKKFKNKNALVIGLHGDLGAGKTTFVQGFLRGLGVRKKITSPTFVIVKSYKLKVISYKLVCHIDCYRIKKPDELASLGIKEIISNPKNIILIEWPERISKILPKDKIQINFKHGRKENERLIAIR